MPLKFILRYFLNQNSEALVQKLAETYPIRRAAQISAFFFHKSKEIGYEVKEQVKATESFKRTKDEINSFDDRVEGFTKTFKKEIRDGFQELKEDIKKQQKDR